MMKIGDSFNKYGTPITTFLCEVCNSRFSVCPAIPDNGLEQWKGCLARNCKSYDPVRDIDKMFDDPTAASIIIRVPTGKNQLSCDRNDQ